MVLCTETSNFNLKTIFLCLAFIVNLRTSSIKNIYDYIKQKYGHDVIKILHKLFNTTRKYEKAKLDHDFLCTCKTYNVFPKFLRFKLYKKNLNHSTFYRSWQTKLLNYEINCKNSTVQKLYPEILSLKRTLPVTFLDSLIIRKFLNSSTTQFRNSTKVTHRKKLSYLGIANPMSHCEPNRVIFNYSSIQLSDRLKTILSLGLDFSLPIYSLNFYKYFLSFEKLVFNMKEKCNDDQSLANFIRETRNVALKYFYNFKPFKVFSSIIKKNDFKLLRELGRNKDIVVCRPDKGNGVVILDRIDYVNSLNNFISDTSKFLKITCPIEKFTRQIEDKLGVFLRKIKDKMPDDCYKNLFATGSGPGVLYGTAKIHKTDFSTNFQFRPIFASYNTPTYKLAKFLVPHLNHLTINEYTLDNSYKFTEEIAKVRNVQNLIMVSFDITNLFTNIPLSETIDICLKLLFDNGNSFLGLNRAMFGKLLEIAVTNSFFMFNSNFYKQIDGLGMGLPLGPTFANIFLSYHEKNWLSSCPVDFRPKFYKRYIDDIFMLFSDPDQVSKFLDYMNSRHPNIKFNAEI